MDERQRWARRLATSFGLGDRLPAPGTTAGSFPAALLWLVVMALTPGSALALAVTSMLVVAAVVGGLWASEIEARRRGGGDPGPVVIDEVAGQWLTYAVAMPFVAIDGWLALVIFSGAGFFIFRFFDIVKVWPASAFERLPGGLGIMADDLAAALYSGGLLVLLGRWLL